MTQTIKVNEPLVVTHYMDRDAPKPLTFWHEDNAGLPEVRSATLTCVITNGAAVLTKTVGAGITLSLLNPETNVSGAVLAFVTLQLTAAELSGFSLGNTTSFEFREGAADPKTLVMEGRFVLR
jgi:hypothetical protein